MINADFFWPIDVLCQYPVSAGAQQPPCRFSMYEDYVTTDIIKQETTGMEASW